MSTPVKKSRASENPDTQGRWVYAYFVLAAFDVLTVAFTLYLNHQLMGIYNDSIVVNQEWAQRQGRYAELGELASQVNAPGNDVFDSKNVAAERERLESHLQAFERSMREARKDLETRVDPEHRGGIGQSLDQVDLAMSGMTSEASRIFGYFERDQGALAGSRMATMDRRYADLTNALADVGRLTREIQREKLNEQQATAERLRRFEYAIGVLILLMVLGITIYGHSMIRHTRDFWRRLEWSERRMTQIFQHSENGIVLVDGSGLIRLMNPAAARMTGIPAPDAKAKTFEEVFQGARIPDTDDEGELEIQLQRGPDEFVELAMVFGSAESAEENYRVVSFSDVTQRKQIQDASETARKAAEDAVAAKAGFVASMSHEIRTPLNAVIGAISLLRGSDLKPDQREDVEILRVGSENLLSIVNKVLDFSKIEAGKMELDPVDFSLHQCLVDVGKLFSRTALEKGVRLVWAYDPDLPDRVHGDVGRIRQVLGNLIGNSLKFSERGLVELYAEPTHHSQAEVGVRFTVRDTGIGMSEEVLAELFQAFKQASASTARKYGGTGLGLAISKTLVELMGGKISVQSIEGKGTKFHVEMTLGIPGEETARSVVSAEAPEELSLPVSALRVLVCDDNPVNRAIARKMLEKLGHLVDVAINGFAAVEAAKRARYDMILMDLNFPDIDGVEAAQLIRAQSEYGEDCEIVVFTAHLSAEDEARFAEVGVRESLHKPVVIEELENLIARIH